ncbi:MAG TPA: hypothetical protein VHF24_03360, partial [Acidimicrobiales bacterium]|nr:hypothetical protein [Acidimicrobiales bacterium]
VIGHRRAVDSTGLADSVLTQDTVSLIRSALRRCLERLEAVYPNRAGRCGQLSPATTTTPRQAADPLGVGR